VVSRCGPEEDEGGDGAEATGSEGDESSRRNKLKMDNRFDFVSTGGSSGAGEEGEFRSAGGDELELFV
jgi:hypothetical protein